MLDREAHGGYRMTTRRGLLAGALALAIRAAIARAAAVAGANTCDAAAAVAVGAATGVTARGAWTATAGLASGGWREQRKHKQSEIKHESSPEKSSEMRNRAKAGAQNRGRAAGHD
jgi:hypothetical protein